MTTPYPELGAADGAASARARGRDAALRGILRAPGASEAIVGRVMSRLRGPDDLPAASQSGGQPRRQRPGFAGYRLLAAAAAVALAVAGVWWLGLRTPAAPGLRLAEVSGGVTVTRGGKATPAKPGTELCQGDQVAVKDGGKAALKYDAEETTIELHSATATFRAEKGAKRVKLAAGTLVCTAAPQRQPFRLETPHAIATVVGTRFWLDVAAAETTLAVQEGKVALRQKDTSLEIKAGETAVADAAGLTKLSADDAWLRELLVRAEAGPWAAVDFTRGSIFGDPVGWRLDLHGESAAWRIWQTDAQASSMVLFDAAKWKRGVIVGRVMMLPEGQLPAALALSAEATAVAWRTEQTSRFGDAPNGVYVAFHWHTQGMEGRTVTLMSHLVVNEQPRGVWHRFAVYFDTDAAPETVVALTSAWPEDHAVSPATRWPRPRGDLFTSGIGKELGFGLFAKGIPALWQGVKIAPLGPDMPPPPGLMRK